MNKSVGILENCATNQAAHFGGPHGMFVDVPVAALLEVLNSRRDLLEALKALREEICGVEQWWGALNHAVDAADDALVRAEPLIADGLVERAERAPDLLAALKVAERALHSAYMRTRSLADADEFEAARDACRVIIAKAEGRDDR